jgi:hypothetical protein
VTLDSSVYERLSFDREVYRRLCDEYEGDCLGAGEWGKRWTNDRAEREFGAAARRGDFSGRGAPRWKQRAFYDFIKDTAPIVFAFPVARIAIWEPIRRGAETRPIGHLLELVADGMPDPTDWAEPMLARVRERTFVADRDSLAGVD